jgi:hypothetical protein
MASQREKLANITLDELADVLSNTTPGGINHGPPMAEFTRRQTEAQLSAAAAQYEAAEAAKATAAYTQQSARYILWSVYAIAASTVLTTIFSALSLWLRR